MRWLVVGANGMLGQDLTALLRDGGDDVTPVDRDTVDITDPGACEAAVAGHDVVVNCAAYTAVDAAESDEAAAFMVNAVGAANLARSAHRAGARTVQISTDYVFDGHADAPYAETAPIVPRSAYGRTKAAGEWAVRAECPDHLVVRTAWLYGANGPCLPSTIVCVLRARGGADDLVAQGGHPSWTVNLADRVERLVRAGAPAGTCHGTSAGQTSWHGFARAAAAAAGVDPAAVRETTSEGFVRPAPRPAYSVLGHAALQAVGVDPIGDWAARWRAAAPEVLG